MDAFIILFIFFFDPFVGPDQAVMIGQRERRIDAFDDAPEDWVHIDKVIALFV